jgi:hypothetical protein
MARDSMANDFAISPPQPIGGPLRALQAGLAAWSLN